MDLCLLVSFLNCLLQIDHSLFHLISLLARSSKFELVRLLQLFDFSVFPGQLPIFLFVFFLEELHELLQLIELSLTRSFLLN